MHHAEIPTLFPQIKGKFKTISVEKDVQTLH